VEVETVPLKSRSSAAVHWLIVGLVAFTASEIVAAVVYVARHGPQADMKGVFFNAAPSALEVTIGILVGNLIVHIVSSNRRKLKP